MKVKKYKNRKLYFDGKYISSIDLINAIKAGDHVEVYHHDTGLDCTEETLKEALYLVTVDVEKLIDMLYNSPMAKTWEEA
jgi:polyhydroxyalkanoate synthesis regulator protein